MFRSLHIILQRLLICQNVGIYSRVVQEVVGKHSGTSIPTGELYWSAKMLGIIVALSAVVGVVHVLYQKGTAGLTYRTYSKSSIGIPFIISLILYYERFSPKAHIFLD